MHPIPILSVFTSQHTPSRSDPSTASANLLQKINNDARIYPTRTLHEGVYSVRFVTSVFDCTRDDVMVTYDVKTELTNGAHSAPNP